MITSVLRLAKMAIFTMHSAPICPACRSVLMTAEHLKLKIDVKNYNLSEGEHKNPEFKKMNPQYTVPTIDDNGFYLYESRAVLAYMMNKYAPDSPVYPKDPAERATVDRMLYFDIGTLYRTQWAVMAPMAFRNEPANPEKMKAFEDTLVLLDEFLNKTAYVAGNHITIADFAIISTLATIQVFLDFSFDKYPRISSWMSKLKKEIPSYEEINEIPVKKHKEYLLAKRRQSSSN
ncbi:glutathione S-transferase 1-1 [Parasteatoda tepidariorum]|uniref:glutathione S-transferase 1-1 n=1 Tax=Parasteatoda tepidariorum TaxID=114398 RepID=UPI001C71AACD|nr:glutathione S-transferase 1-1-like [Parasteatoda tepidariorum]